VTATKAIEEAKLSIEPFEPSDLDAMMEIENASFTAPWSRKSYEDLWSQESIEVWVGWLGEELASYYLVQTVGAEQELHTFAVKAGLRRRGIGRAMMEHLIGRSRARGVKQIFLLVRPSNREARELYKSMGFMGIGIRRNYYRDNFEDALVMLLDLTGQP
jgi:ribosomal-protein-alanine N-acetyltransferase